MIIHIEKSNSKCRFLTQEIFDHSKYIKLENLFINFLKLKI